MLEGKNVNLRVMEKEDLPLIADWFNNPEVFGEYNSLRQMPRTEAEKMFESPLELKPFFIEKKDGSKIGFIAHFYVLHPAGRQLEVGYSLVPSERGKGYCTEALEIMMDFLFLSKEMIRIQAHTDLRNVASQKVLEKVGLKKEGTVRKCFFTRGEWRDAYLYGILREEWKEPKILTKTPKGQHHQ
jgi:RimJ/RimL family protein N-acetyltransferase